MREYEHYEQDYSFDTPIRIGDWIYYRNFTNPADSLTLYRFPIDELENYGFKIGQMPYLREATDEDEHEVLEKLEKLKQSWPEETVFTL